jgi:hypothetical protein
MDDDSSTMLILPKFVASSIARGLSKTYSNRVLELSRRAHVRPSIASVQTNEVTKRTKCVSENTEADDMVVTQMRKSTIRVYEYLVGLPPRMEPRS